MPGKTGFDDGDWIESPYITEIGIRLIQTGNIGTGQFLDKSDRARFISDQTFRVLNCKWVHPGDILICRLADPIGRACRVPAFVGDSITAVDCTIYRPDPDVVDPQFALHWLNSRWNLKKAEDIAGGSTRQRISRGNLGTLPVPTPPLPEQRRIAEILDTVDEAIQKTEEVIAKLKELKQGLLHDLLTR
ncbi:MAG: restriction endonuclease subunit S, partial [Myxococcales bacterium]|nr:restriction endonuclease subunit S [Myxococcales bacterium]